MITPLLPLDWPVLNWAPVERDNFGLLREASDESEVLADVVSEQLGRALPGPLSEVRLLDYGAEPRSQLSALLRARVGSYTPVQLGGNTEADRYLNGLAVDGQRPAFDAVLLCHVLPYVRRPDRVLSALARYAEPHAVAIAVGLAPHGGQHDLALRARDRNPTYPRRYDHAVHLQRWLENHGIPRTVRIVWSTARAQQETALQQLVEFMLGSADTDLVAAVAATVPRDSDGGAVIRTAHAVLTWPLPRHQLHPPVDDQRLLSARAAAPSPPDR
jgi:hypothetical protein